MFDATKQNRETWKDSSQLAAHETSNSSEDMVFVKKLIVLCVIAEHSEAERGLVIVT